MKKVVLIGYSGHSYVIADILQLNGYTIVGYCEKERKKYNPFNLEYLGSESEEKVLKYFQKSNFSFFPAIGENKIRERVADFLKEQNLKEINVIHPDTSISQKCTLGKGILIAAGVRINSLACIEDGSIINTGAVVEHECKIGKFAHIGPGAVLAGNVEIGDRAFIGANTVIKQGLKIGSDAIIGAGSVVIKNVPNNMVVAGNPSSQIKK